MLCNIFLTRGELSGVVAGEGGGMVQGSPNGNKESRRDGHVRSDVLVDKSLLLQFHPLRRSERSVP